MAPHFPCIFPHRSLHFSEQSFHSSQDRISVLSPCFVPYRDTAHWKLAMPRTSVDCSLQISVPRSPVSFLIPPLGFAALGFDFAALGLGLRALLSVVVFIRES